MSNTSFPMGSAADHAAGVRIAMLYGGWFSNPAVIRRFFDLGIAPQLATLPQIVRYADLGGGMGDLCAGITVALREKGFGVHATVIDGNPDNLPFIREKGLGAQYGDIVSDCLPASDLITVRSVLHYNSPRKQQKLLRNAYTALRPGGILVCNQPTGTAAHCAMRGEVMTHPALLPNGSRYSWPSCEELLALFDNAGFDTVFAGEIDPTYGWSAADQWERFNRKIELSLTNPSEQEAFARRKETFLDAACDIFETYRRRFGDAWVRLEGDGRQTRLVTYQPVYVSRKKA